MLQVLPQRSETSQLLSEEIYRKRRNPLFSVYDELNPIVTIQQNFDNLLIPVDHVSRSKTDCYYVNQRYLLRAHTTSHQVDLISSGLDNFLVLGEVYRRDEIDIDAIPLETKDKLFERNPGLEIFERDWSPNLYNSNQNQVLTSSNCMDQTKQSCHTLEAIKLIEHELKGVLAGLAKDLFGANTVGRTLISCLHSPLGNWKFSIKNNGLKF
uniref:Phenylalanyl-tRNA synthetase domain-containing protein n=1 Tax=Glossina pallidipes TaxID=7398 RepID=A0A1A9ZP30_GLOPL